MPLRTSHTLQLHNPRLQQVPTPTDSVVKHPDGAANLSISKQRLGVSSKYRKSTAPAAPLSRTYAISQRFVADLGADDASPALILRCNEMHMRAGFWYVHLNNLAAAHILSWFSVLQSVTIAAADESLKVSL